MHGQMLIDFFDLTFYREKQVLTLRKRNVGIYHHTAQNCFIWQCLMEKADTNPI